MPQGSSISQAIAKAEALLPGHPAPDGEQDPRWQAIIQIGQFIETNPEEVWEFTRRWGKHAQADLRAAIATCLLEHLLERRFDLIFPRIRNEANSSVRFASTLLLCWSFGQAERPVNARRMAQLKGELRRKHGTRRR